VPAAWKDSALGLQALGLQIPTRLLHGHQHPRQSPQTPPEPLRRRGQRDQVQGTLKGTDHLVRIGDALGAERGSHRPEISPDVSRFDEQSEVAEPHCRAFGYVRLDLRGDRCPECGEMIAGGNPTLGVNT
jgi:hypothetical protein